jgi:hypothetical protein
MVDGAEHTAEVGRLLAYAASASGEGVIGVQDCAVVASAIPDSNVHILSGAVSVLNRFPGGGQQSYLLRNVGDEVVALTPQGSSGVRYDLVAVIVEDPQYPGQPAPASVPDGPYLRSQVYEDVDPSTRTLAEVDPDQTGYALALVKFDASDGTVHAVDITDLRELVLPRSFRRVYPVTIPNNDALDSAVAGKWPDAEQSVRVPTWATKAVIVVHLVSIVHFAPGLLATLRVVFGDLLGNVLGVDLDLAAGAERMAFTVTGSFDVPEEMLGTVQDVYIQAARVDETGTLNTWSGASMVMDISFYEEPA